MATMGVKMVGDDGAGYGKLANTLASALFGNAETEMKMALMRQDYDSEAWRRKVMDAQAANQQAVADTANWALQRQQEALDPTQDYFEGLVPELAPVEVTTQGPPQFAVPQRKVQTTPFTRADVDTSPWLPGTSFGPVPEGYIAPVEMDPLLYNTPAPVTTLQEPTAEQQAARDREVAFQRAKAGVILGGGGNAEQVAAGLGQGEGSILLKSPDKEKQRQGELLYTGDAGKTTAAVGGKAAQEMRKEITALPAYKDFADIQGVYSSMLKSAKLNTKAAFMDLVYGIATLEDPGSVVREQDQLMVQRTGGLSADVQAFISYFNNQGQLTPEMKAGIMQIAANRFGGYKDAFDTQMEQYRGRAERQGLLIEDVIPEFGNLGEYVQPLPPGVTEEMVNAKIRQKAQETPPQTITRDEAIMLLSAGRR